MKAVLQYLSLNHRQFKFTIILMTREHDKALNSWGETGGDYIKHLAKCSVPWAQLKWSVEISWAEVLTSLCLRIFQHPALITPDHTWNSHGWGKAQTTPPTAPHRPTISLWLQLNYMTAASGYFFWEFLSAVFANGPVSAHESHRDLAAFRTFQICGTPGGTEPQFSWCLHSYTAAGCQDSQNHRACP